MKKLLLFIPLCFIAAIVMAQPPKGPANAGMSFGAKTTADGAIEANLLATKLTDKSDTDVKVKGKVVDVCKMEGCWLKMQTDKGPIMVKMKDHSFMVPVEMNGKTIVAQGVATNKETSVEMLRHYAEDAGKSKEEIAAITEPKKEIILQATGILVL